MPAACSLICTSSATGSPRSISSTLNRVFSSQRRAPLVFIAGHHRTRCSCVLCMRCPLLQQSLDGLVVKWPVGHGSYLATRRAVRPYWHRAAMGVIDGPFIGTEALTAG